MWHRQATLADQAHAACCPSTGLCKLPRSQTCAAPRSAAWPARPAASAARRPPGRGSRPSARRVGPGRRRRRLVGRTLARSRSLPVRGLPRDLHRALLRRNPPWLLSQDCPCTSAGRRRGGSPAQSGPGQRRRRIPHTATLASETLVPRLLPAAGPRPSTPAGSVRRPARSARRLARSVQTGARSPPCNSRRCSTASASTPDPWRFLQLHLPKPGREGP
mmetsp:Transcript_58390/g.161539  ORF Transcript_58390/g.161539 Transcript_58390/m.161539 type:complete len:219 (-) Transcript_58390:7-663(-)